MRDYRAEAEREVNALTPVLADDERLRRIVEDHRAFRLNLFVWACEAIVIGLVAGALFEMVW